MEHFSNASESGEKGASILPMSAQATLLPQPSVEFELAEKAFRERRITQALCHFSKAESLGYDSDECAANRWYCWMLLGKFERAWRESESIASRGRSSPSHLWDGADFCGKRLIIRCLHGLGDAIQFIRYAELLRSSVSNITVETNTELLTLFRSLSYVDNVVSWEDGSSHHYTDWDQQIEVMELPGAFGTSYKTIPSAVPYIHVNPIAQQQSRSLLGRSQGLRKIGVVWQSGNWNPARSLPAVLLSPLLKLPGCRFFSFQRGPARSDLSVLRNVAFVHDTAEHSPDIADTAADLVNMDLIITVDTMLAHLAGALGKKVWMLLPFEADWRWMLDTSISPWYPTMTLFRQSSQGDWSDVIHAVTEKMTSESRMTA